MRDLGDVLADLSSDGGEDAHLYSTLAPVYDFVYERHFDYDGQRELVDETAPDAESVLEVGCGTGRLLAELEARYGTAVGLERSEAMAERARARTDAEIVIGDATSAELDGAFDEGVVGTFDAVVMLGRVTGHFVEDDAAECAVGNCLAHLRPGGVLLFDYFSTERTEDGYEKVETFESEDYRVTKANASGISDANPGLMKVEFEYEIIDRQTGECATVSETMTLRAFAHDEVRDLLADAGFSEVTIRPEAADGWPLAVARRAERND